MNCSTTNILLAFLIMILISCAQYGVPGGGPNDISPPEVNWEESDSNYQTNFNQKSIKISFNEWITVRNAIKEIVISPPLIKPPKVSVKGKSVIIEFAEDEILKSDATYQINFGDAIRDFTAGNIIKNFLFVFSTGDIIDSLSISGQVKDELTGQTAKDVLVLLYHDLSDTVLYNKKPFYFAKSDEQGNFELKNLREDTFQIYALKDENVSYTYDLPTEKVGFYNSLIFTGDTSPSDIQLSIFDEEDPVRLIDKRQNSHGLITIKYDPQPSNIKVSCSDTTLLFFHEQSSDTIYLWHNAGLNDSIDFVLEHEVGIDTFNNYKSRTHFNSIPLGLKSARKSLINYHEGDTLWIELNKPLAVIDTSLISVRDSSSTVLGNQFGYLKRSLWSTGNYTSNSSYTIQILPEALQDWYGVNNVDTINIEAKGYNSKSFGNVFVDIVNIDEYNYIIELKDKIKVIKSVQVDSSKNIVYEKRPAGSYKLNIIEDANRDGRWTPGKLKERIKSERVKEVILEELNEGWDLRLNLDIKETFNGT